MIITAAQLRACLGILDSSMDKLAKDTGFSRTLIHNLASGKTKITEKHAAPIIDLFNRRGYSFTDTGGIEPAGALIKTYRGRSELKQFVDDIYNTVARTGAEIITYNVNEAVFDKYLGTYVDDHIARMDALGSVKCRAIISQKNSPQKADSYATYRYLEDGQNEGLNAFYAYDNRLAMIEFNGDYVEVAVIHSDKFAALNKALFNAAWANAKPVSRDDHG